MWILATLFTRNILKMQTTNQGVFGREWRRMCTLKDENTQQLIDEAVCKKEPAQLQFCPDEEVFDSCKEIVLDEKEDLIPLHPEVPCDYLTERVAYIKKRTKNVMQQGTNNIHSWILTYNYTKSWENPLMGWNSTGDSLSPISLTFNNVDDAVRHCEKFGWQYQIEKEPPIKKPFILKSYAANFAFKNRTRVSTK